MVSVPEKNKTGKGDGEQGWGGLHFSKSGKTFLGR